MGPGASLAKCPLPSSEIKSSPPLPSHTHHSKLEAVLLEIPVEEGRDLEGQPQAFLSNQPLPQSGCEPVQS